jgi:serine/alanine adding enzyme
VNAQIVHTLPEERWRRFVAEHPQGNVFHTPEMFEVFRRTARHQPELWAALDPRGQPLALLLPVGITLLPGLLSRLTSRAVAYGSILCAPCAAGREALALLLQRYRRSVRGRYLFTELRNVSNLSDLQPLLQAEGFAFEEHLNYLIGLDRSRDELWASMGRRTRKQIRRGLRSGQVAIHEVDQAAQIPYCYELLARTYARVRVPLADYSLFGAAFDVLYPKRMVKFLQAQVGEEYVATSVELIYKDRILGWYGATERAYSQFTPTEALTWHILRWGADNGYRVYDFGGAGRPGEPYGVRDFKAKFGGELVNYGRNTCIHAPARFAISKAGYGVYRRLRSLKT